MPTHAPRRRCSEHWLWCLVQNNCLSGNIFAQKRHTTVRTVSCYQVECRSSVLTDGQPVQVRAVMHAAYGLAFAKLLLRIFVCGLASVLATISASLSRMASAQPSANQEMDRGDVSHSSLQHVRQLTPLSEKCGSPLVAEWYACASVVAS